MKLKLISSSTIALLAALGALHTTPAAAQLVPEPWVTIGGKDGGVSYGAGVRIFDLGAEIGNNNGKTGVDLLKFFSVPTISPYVGLGIYGSDVAYSGGVQFSPPGNTFFGVGYHSIRGINGQLGIKF
ncbi:hypothetical protein [Chamaesiphon minutus]|uniref:Outer membrane protein beta-barrel domain-containing protein n=1 Tax=Chamaesiphon minutus (strain ATCC 27169 / PCC 6605) TaxID=1173020 RepID=K9UBS7_CHAP6|nr:hypothetical protein [Chamaesiphon minutus]AFY91674.1 hypothetical protein Cha6605_0376 [Chamaesiphon minutus PCC 6605]